MEFNGRIPNPSEMVGEPWGVSRKRVVTVIVSPGKRCSRKLPQTFPASSNVSRACWPKVGVQKSASRFVLDDKVKIDRSSLRRLQYQNNAANCR